MAGTTKRFSQAALAALTCVAGLALGADAAEAGTTPIGAWEPRSPMPTARSDAAAFAVPGGLFVIDNSYASVGAASADRYDEASDSWTTVGSAAGSHNYKLRAAALAGGRVAVVGGGSSAVDVWDSATGWTPLPAMSVARDEPAVLELPDGRILVVGSDGFSGPAQTAELYSPSSDTWTAVAAPPHTGAIVAGLLTNGRVLVLSGYQGTVYRGAVWNPATDTWVATPDVREGRATMVGGTAVVVGTGDDDRSTWRYDVAQNRWVKLGDRALSRYNPSLAALADGRVLIASGKFSDYDSQGERSAELLGADGAWTPTGRLWFGRVGGTVAATPQGAFVVGGSHGSANVERFDLAATPPPYEAGIRACSATRTRLTRRRACRCGHKRSTSLLTCR